MRRRRDVLAVLEKNIASIAHVQITDVPAVAAGIRQIDFAAFFATLDRLVTQMGRCCDGPPSPPNARSIGSTIPPAASIGLNHGNTNDGSKFLQIYIVPGAVFKRHHGPGLRTGREIVEFFTATDRPVAGHACRDGMHGARNCADVRDHQTVPPPNTAA
jgi:hypothetical protein